MNFGTSHSIRSIKEFAFRNKPPQRHNKTTAKSLTNIIVLVLSRLRLRLRQYLFPLEFSQMLCIPKRLVLLFYRYKAKTTLKFPISNNPYFGSNSAPKSLNKAFSSTTFIYAHYSNRVLYFAFTALIGGVLFELLCTDFWS